MAETINVITICGSLRKGSYNAALASQLPGFAPPGMSIKPAPAWDKMPIYNRYSGQHRLSRGCRDMGRRHSWRRRRDYHFTGI